VDGAPRQRGDLWRLIRKRRFEAYNEDWMRWNARAEAEKEMDDADSLRLAAQRRHLEDEEEGGMYGDGGGVDATFASSSGADGESQGDWGAMDMQMGANREHLAMDMGMLGEVGGADGAMGGMAAMDDSGGQYSPQLRLNGVQVAP
jgi:hypothetical protein